jgi:hypothetical protein
LTPFNLVFVLATWRMAGKVFIGYMACSAMLGIAPQEKSPGESNVCSSPYSTICALNANNNYLHSEKRLLRELRRGPWGLCCG